MKSDYRMHTHLKLNFKRVSYIWNGVFRIQGCNLSKISIKLMHIEHEIPITHLDEDWSLQYNEIVI